MTRIIHTADLHLDSPLKSLALRDADLRARVESATRAALTRIVDTALSERVAAVLIAGDLFDGAERSARTAAFLLGELDRLRSGEVRVFYIKGNHDAENPVTGALDLPGNVHVFDARGGRLELDEGIWIHGVSFSGRHAPDSLLPRFSAPVEGAVNIAMLHTSLAGAAGHDVYAPCSIADLAGKRFDYWALGHVHRRHVHGQDPWIVMPGMPQGRDMGEAGPKSATILTVADERIEVEEVPTSSVEFLDSTFDVTGVESDEGLRADLRRHLHKEAEALCSPTGVLRLTLAGASPHRWQVLRDRDVWTEQVTAMARDTGLLWLERLVLDLDVPDAEVGTSAAIGELSRIMTEIRAEAGFVATARAEAEAVLADTPPVVRARLWPDEAGAEALIDSLAQTGSERVLAQMKGTEG